MGRSSKLTPKLRETLCEAIGNGNTYENAAKLAGIDQSTFWRWIKKGQNGEAQYESFLIDIEKAEAAAEDRAVRIVQASGLQGNWQAAAWFLERRNPEKFGKRIIDVNETKNINVNVTAGEDVAALMDEWRTIKGEPVEETEAELVN